MKHVFQAVLFILACAGPWAAAAEPREDPMDVLRRGVDEVLNVAYAENPPAGQPLSERVRPVLERYFDLDSITRRAVGPGWRSLTPEERARTTELFAALVLRTYADSFQPGKRPEIQFGTAAKLANTRSELPTTIVYQGQKYSVAYRMEVTAAGWRIYDVIIEGVSMIANYRAQFEPILQKGKAKALIAALEENLKNVPPPK